MSTELRLFAAILVLCGCTQQDPDRAQPPEATADPAVPAAGTSSAAEMLRTEIPAGWVQLRNTNTANLKLAEYVPADTGEVWQQKLTVEAMSGAFLPDPLVVAQGLAEEQADLCGKFVDSGIFSGDENGYPTVVRLFECHDNKRTRKPLVTMLKLIRGEEQFYSITRIWRLERPEDGAELPISKEELAAWSDALGNMIACKPGATDHPCVASQSEPASGR